MEYNESFMILYNKLEYLALFSTVWFYYVYKATILIKSNKIRFEYKIKMII